MDVRARGELDPAAPSLRLEVEARRTAFHWDPVMPVLDILAALVHADPAKPEPDLPVLARAWTLPLDDQGREVGRSTQSGCHSSGYQVHP